MPFLSRREVLGAGSAVIALAAMRCLRAQTPTPTAASAPWAGEKIVDFHFHPRKTAELQMAHMDGADISNGMILALNEPFEQFGKWNQAQPGRLVGYTVTTDLTKSGFEDILTYGVENGAIGFGEIRSRVALAGPEMRRVYALAAELNVPITMHMQDAGGTGSTGGFNFGFNDLESMLKAFPKTRFVGHAESFWANIDAAYDGHSLYPRGRVTPGGLTDRLLSDYENLYGDMSATSGYVALARDPEFTPGFLRRHRDKLIFGSDCFCLDGHGAGNNMGPMKGKCIARETLTVLIRSVDKPTFAKVVRTNGHKIFRLTA